MNYIDEANQTKSDQFHGELVSASYLKALVAGIAARLIELDKVKKALFYGKLPEGQRGFIAEGDTDDCHELPNILIADRGVGIDLIHGIIGKATEAGELLEAMLAVLDSPFEYIDATNIKEEVADGQWYDAIIAKALGFTFEEIQATNIAKLRARYPNKFSEYDAINRDLGVEREILESDVQPEGYVTTLSSHSVTSAQAAALITDLSQAASTLRRYEKAHRAKGTDDSNAKAEVNAALAARFELTLENVTGHKQGEE